MRKYLLPLVLIILLCTATVEAQVLRTGGNAGAVNRNYTEQVKKLEQDKEYIETVPEDLDAEKKRREEEERKLRDIQRGGVIYNPKFELKDLNFEGNTIYSDEELKSMAEDLIGKEVYLADVMDYIVKVSRHYQQNGYLTTYAYIPEQEAENGVIKIVISESKVGQKRVTGNFWVRKFYITDILSGCSRLGVGRIFNLRQLQGVVKTINREPYMNTIVAIEKDKDETVIDFDMKDRFPIRLSTSWDDFGRDLIGRQRWSAILGMYNLTGFGDSIYGGPILADRSQAVVAGYEIPIAPCLTTLGFEFSGVKVKPGGEFAELGIEGVSRFFTLIAKHTFINNATTDLIGYTAFDWIDTNTEITPIEEKIVDYALRIPRFGANLIHDDTTGRWIGNTEASFGIDGLGSTGNVDGGPQTSFQKFTGSLIRVQRLPRDILGIVRVNGQYSPQSLFAAVQMYIGGPYNIWGFQPSELLGDWGVAGGEELRFPIPYFKEILPEKLKPISDRVRLMVFHNWGFVQQQQDVEDLPKNFIQSVGFGSYIGITDAISALIGVGFPIGSRFFDQTAARMFFTINSDIDRFLKPRSHSSKERVGRIKTEKQETTALEDFNNANLSPNLSGQLAALTKGEIKPFKFLMPQRAR